MTGQTPGKTTRHRLIADRQCSQLPTKTLQLLDRYLEVISLIEKTYRDYLASIGRHLARMGVDDINGLQASILLHIGEDRIAVNEIKTRGNYLGANRSYITKKLIENGYLSQARSVKDGRVSEIWLTDKGRILSQQLAEMHAGFTDVASEADNTSDLQRAVWTLRQIEQLWIDQELSLSNL
jgi:DNA-binding MarR family transcriptional regulator